jgi:hypothetical protein
LLRLFSSHYFNSPSASSALPRLPYRRFGAGLSREAASVIVTEDDNTNEPLFTRFFFHSPHLIFFLPSSQDPFELHCTSPSRRSRYFIDKTCLKFNRGLLPLVAGCPPVVGVAVTAPEVVEVAADPQSLTLQSPHSRTRENSVR